MNELLRKRLSFIRAGMETKRYHVVPTLGANTVAHHSFGVAWLALLLVRDEYVRGAADHEAVLALLGAALSHDIAEHQAGDIPADVKRRLGLGDVFGDYEMAALAGLEMDYELDPGLTRMLKFADCADGALFCCRERAMGNKLITPTYHNYRAYLNELNPRLGAEQDVVAFIDEEWSAANA